MSNDTDVIVVGAGLAGLAAAAELIDAGRRMILLDQEPEVSLGGQAFSLLDAVQSRHLQDIKIMLPPLPGALTTMPTVDNTAAIGGLQAGTSSITITTQAQYYMHAKLIIIDQRLAFVGSQNLTREALNYNREVGIMLKNAESVKTLSTTFLSDWVGAYPSQGSPAPNGLTGS